MPWIVGAQRIPLPILPGSGLIPGAVTPLGILNDTEKKVHFYLDKHFLEEPGLVGVHPNDNTATVWLKTEDLIRIIEEHEHDVTLVSLD